MNGAAHPRAVIAVPRMGLYSETFIAAHIERLQNVAAVITDGVLPSRVHDGRLLLRRSGPGRLMDHVEARLRGLDINALLRSRITGVLRQQGVQVVLAEYGTCGEALVGPCQRAGVPLVAHFHGFDAYNTSLPEAHGYARLFAYASKLVVVSRAMEERLIALGAPREKLVYNCYGVDLARFHAGTTDPRPPHFVAVGRFVDKKAPQVLLSAFERVAQEVPHARLTMAGTGPLWEACAQRVRQGVLAGRVDLPGVLAPEQVAGLLRTARVFVQHSVQGLNGDSEGTPLAVLEAMASAIPVIATRHGGIPDVVLHDREGLLSDELNVEEMSAHMIQLAQDPELAGRMGEAGRARAEREFRVEQSVARLQATLDAV